MRRWFTEKGRARDTLAAFGFLFLVAVAIVLFLPVFPDSYIGRAYVVDGDSLEISGNRFRLVGIDAPEGRQTCLRNGQVWLCGVAATRALRQKIDGRNVNCTGRAFDQFDRILADCSINGESLNAWMVINGWAVAFGAYDREEREARNAQRGLWASTFDDPQIWRDNHR